MAVVDLALKRRTVDIKYLMKKHQIFRYEIAEVLSKDVATISKWQQDSNLKEENIRLIEDAISQLINEKEA